MTPLITDIIIISLLFISAIIAFIRGFIKEVLTIFSLLGALGAAYVWGSNLMPLFEKWGVDIAGGSEEKIFGLLSPTLFAAIGAHASIFLVLFIILTLLSIYIGKMVQDMGLGSVDRTLGFVFGLARGLLIIAILNIPVMHLMDKKDQPSWLTQAKTIPFVNKTSQAILDMRGEAKEDDKTKSELSTKTKEFMEQIDKQTEELQKSGEGYKEDTRDALDDLIQDVQQ